MHDSTMMKAEASFTTSNQYRLRMSNFWLPAVTWAKALDKSGHIDHTIVIVVNAQKFNTAISKSTLIGEMMTLFDGSY